MKNIFLTPFLCLALTVLNGQQFDSLAYQQTYKRNFESFFYADSLDEASRIAGLSRAWAEAKWNFANFDLTDSLEWDKKFYSYIPKVKATKSYTGYYKVLMEFYTHLKDGHSLIIPPRTTWDTINAGLPVRVREFGDLHVITDNFQLDSTYSDLKVGTVLHRINGMGVKDYARQYISPYLSHSTPQDSIARLYSFFISKGSKYDSIELEISFKGSKPTLVRLPRTVQGEVFPAAKGFAFKRLNPKTGLLTINTFNDPKVVDYYDSLFPTLTGIENLIIDLRKNGGGNGNNGFELLGYLTDKPFISGNSIVRKYTPPFRGWGMAPDELATFKDDWKPFKTPVFKGKVVVLTGPDTYSAAEDFVVAFKHAGRGLIIGQTTGGSTGQPLYFPLPGGGMGFVCSKRDLFIDNTEFIGIGIRPDIKVSYSYENFINGKDEALEAALESF